MAVMGTKDSAISQVSVRGVISLPSGITGRLSLGVVGEELRLDLSK